MMLYMHRSVAEIVRAFSCLYEMAQEPRNTEWTIWQQMRFCLKQGESSNFRDSSR
jgi:hypothetical protein